MIKDSEPLNLDFEQRERNLQEVLVHAVEENIQDMQALTGQADEILERTSYRFTNTATPIFPYSLIPMVISDERQEQYTQQDYLIDRAIWKILRSPLTYESSIILSGFNPFEQRLVLEDLEERTANGLDRRMFRRIDRLGGKYNLLLGPTDERQIIEENSNSPDGGAYQYGLALAFNEVVLPAIRRWSGTNLPDIPLVWDNLIEEMQRVAIIYGRDGIKDVALVYLEEGNHIAKDSEMPILATYLRGKGLNVDFINQHNASGVQLYQYDAIYRAFDTSHKLSESGLNGFVDNLRGLPIVGKPSEVLFGAKTAMGILSRAARTKDSRLTEEENVAINKALGWKDVIHPTYSPTVITPDGTELFWKDFLNKHGQQVYMKQNIGGSGYDILRVGGNGIQTVDQLVAEVEKAFDRSALEIEGMVATPKRPFALKDNGSIHFINGSSDYTEYYVGGKPTKTGFGRFNVIEGLQEDDPRILKNVTQGAKFSPLLVVPQI